MSCARFKVSGRLTRASRGSSGEAAADTRTLEHTQKALMELLLLGNVES